MIGSVLRPEEKLIFSLRELYEAYGYQSYQMSRFDEYELYVRNKAYMHDDRIISFHDTNGKLLALKPDVTLSIIRSTKEQGVNKRKVYYDESVFRVSDSTKRYKEIKQAGLECIGSLDLYDVFESLYLAAKTLQSISPDFVLCISHLGILSPVLAQISTDEEFTQRAVSCIRQRNQHDLKRLCESCGVSDTQYEWLCVLLSAYGDRANVLSSLQCFGLLPSLKEMETLSAMLDKTEFADRFCFDFSIVNDMDYYNGFTFSGFLNGVSTAVLSGGQYDKLLEKMDLPQKGIGFALNLDLLEPIFSGARPKKVDTAVLYDDPALAAEKVLELSGQGKSVFAAAELNDIAFDELIDLRGEDKSC